MAIKATNIQTKNVSAPDEVRAFALGHMDIVSIGQATLGRAVFEPGWRWSDSIKPIVGTTSCEVAHVGYMIRGHMRVRMNDGTEYDGAAGDFVVFQPGHDAWVVGDEPVEYLELAGARDYATARHVHGRPAAVTLLPDAEARATPHDLEQTSAEAALRADTGAGPLTRERMVALVRRFIELGNAGRGNAFDEVFADDVVDHDAFPGQAPGIKGFCDSLDQLRKGFPDLRAEAGEPLVEGDRVAFHMSFTGTHAGEFMGISATEKPVHFGGMLIFRVLHGRVVDSWGTVDGLNLLDQLGVAPWQQPSPASVWPTDEEYV